MMAKGQRWISESEPELGIGICVEAGAGRISLLFPATGLLRQYASESAPIKRVEFRAGDRITTHAGESFTVDSVENAASGIVIYRAGERSIPETELSDTLSFSKPEERLLMGQVDESSTFDLRFQAMKCRHRIRYSPVRGFVGGRIELIPHQLYVANEVASRLLPRVLLADEVGLGKTIEACLILHRLHRSGRAGRILVLLPEPLIHQWFVELLRRFNLRFAIFDEERCASLEANGGNPFLDDQLILCPIGLLAGDERRCSQAAEAGWDLVIVDEAHHLAWTPQAVSPEYAAVAAVAAGTDGLILLTATPEQLGLEGHFARLRLLDPDRFSDFERFKAEREEYQKIARVAGKLIEGGKLTAADSKALAGWIGHKGTDPLALVSELLDRNGTGRVMFRNTRAAIQGFPKRKVQLTALGSAEASPSRAGSALVGFEARIDWLVKLIKKLRNSKILLICQAKAMVLAIDEALRERLNIKVGLFHEDLTLIQRDRNAAWFSEEDGAQLLLCSEIGSEGRNFQFAHHLVLFDLPANPELLEQRIGRLDRIGQTETIRIHVPYPIGTELEALARWYHEGLNAFSKPMQGGAEVSVRFNERLQSILETFDPEALESLITETREFHAGLLKRLEQGQDRLLQMSSCRAEPAGKLVKGIAAIDADRSLEPFMVDMFSFFGVHVEELSDRTFLALPGTLTSEVVPGLPPEGLTLTCDRAKALAREEIGFLTWDHPIVTGVIDLLLGSERGNSSFAVWVTPGEQAIYLETIHLLEVIAPPGLHADRFLAPTALRVVVNAKGEDCSSEVNPKSADLFPGSVHRLLDTPRIKQQLIPAMLERSRTVATTLAERAIAAGETAMRKMLEPELKRLTDLSKVNDHIQPQEIEALRRQIAELGTHVSGAQLRLEAVRLIWKSPVAPER